DAVTAWAARNALDPQSSSAVLDRSTFVGSRRVSSRLEVTKALDPGRAGQAAERGAAMSLVTAAEYVLMLTAPNSPSSAEQAMPGNLSARERELVTLVAQG